MAVILALAITYPAGGKSESAPGFSLPSLSDDQVIRLSDLKGNVVYIDFWASWCGPCRQSLPLYESMNQSFSDESFSLVAINLDEDREDALRFLKQHPVSYLVAFDPMGESAIAWSVKAMPSSFLVDRDGAIVREWAGFKPSHIEDIEREIRRLLE